MAYVECVSEAYVICDVCALRICDLCDTLDGILHARHPLRSQDWPFITFCLKYQWFEQPQQLIDGLSENRLPLSMK